MELIKESINEQDTESIYKGELNLSEFIKKSGRRKS